MAPGTPQMVSRWYESIEASLVQFEQDFNTHTEKWYRDERIGWLSQTRLIPRSPDGDKKCIYYIAFQPIVMPSSGWSLRTTTHGQCKWAVQDEDQDALGAVQGQSQKNPVSASAMLTGKVLRIRKVFVTCSLLAEEFPDYLENVRMLHKISR